MAVAAAGAMLSASGVVAATSGLLHTADVEAASAPSSSTVTTVPLTTTSLDPVVVTETRDIYDTIVVPTSATPAPAPAPAPGPAPAPAAPLPVTSGSATPPAPAAPVATTTTERPDGVPESWPEGQPIPPMPPDCQKPQLEDNGVWNCDH
jgi:hypothetical protein